MIEHRDLIDQSLKPQTHALVNARLDQQIYAARKEKEQLTRIVDNYERNKIVEETKSRNMGLEIKTLCDQIQTMKLKSALFSKQIDEIAREK